MVVDTGVSLSLISEKTYSSISSILGPLTPSDVILTTYTGEKRFPLGYVTVYLLNTASVIDIASSTR